MWVHETRAICLLFIIINFMPLFYIFVLYRKILSHFFNISKTHVFLILSKLHPCLELTEWLPLKLIMSLNLIIIFRFTIHFYLLWDRSFLTSLPQIFHTQISSLVLSFILTVYIFTHLISKYEALQPHKVTLLPLIKFHFPGIRTLVSARSYLFSSWFSLFLSFKL